MSEFDPEKLARAIWDWYTNHWDEPDEAKTIATWTAIIRRAHDGSEIEAPCCKYFFEKLEAWDKAAKLEAECDRLKAELKKFTATAKDDERADIKLEDLLPNPEELDGLLEDKCPSCDQLKAECDRLRAEVEEIDYEKALLLELLRLPHSEMDEVMYQDWYRCAQGIVNGFEKGTRGIELTARWDEHPEGFDVPCVCKLCQSYGD